MKAAEILVVGTGLLAAGVVNALTQGQARATASKTTGNLRIALMGRSAAKASRLAQIANARAAAFGTRATFEPIAMAEFKALALSRIIRRLKPKVIFQVASIQSPWEAAQGQNGWTRLLAAGGFGITLPLQMALAAEISQGAAESEAAIVNASYPDCVNVALDRLGLRTTCGIGNCAIVEAFCRAYTGLNERDVCVVGHHGHLSGWLQAKWRARRPRVWVKGKEIQSSAFRPDLWPMTDELNQVTAATAAPVVMALATGATLRVSIPGVAGLPGGYPLELRRGKFTLRLPPGVILAEAIAHNKGGERLDGLDLGSGVKYIGRAREALSAAGFECAEGFDLSEWREAMEKMMRLRERLRRVSG